MNVNELASELDKLIERAVADRVENELHHRIQESKVGMMWLAEQ